MTEPRCDFLCRSCFCSRRGNQKRERFGNQRGLFRSLEFQRVLRLHDHLSAIPGLDTRKNDAQPHADARGHRCKEANLVDTVIQAGRCVLGDNADLHGERGNHGKRQVTVRDRAAERAFPRGAFYIDMDPLTIAGAGREGVDPLLVDCHPIGNAKLSPDPFAQASKCKLTHASLPEFQCVKEHGRNSYSSPYFSRNSFLLILPTLVLGSLSIDRIFSGMAYLEMMPLSANTLRCSLMIVSSGALEIVLSVIALRAADIDRRILATSISLPTMAASSSSCTYGLIVPP